MLGWELSIVSPSRHPRPSHLGLCSGSKSRSFRVCCLFAIFRIALGIKEVSFVAELFVVLEHGRRAQLCMARFTQRKGAASSFSRVVDTLEVVLKGRGLLVEEAEKTREMEGILGGN